MGLDSVELIMDVEKHFSICIPDREAEKAYTVGKLVDCVANILGINSYDFSLREKAYLLLKTELLQLKENLNDFSITTRVTESLDIRDKSLLQELGDRTGLKLSDIYFTSENDNRILGKVKEWFRVIEEIDFEKITWKKFIDITLARNLEVTILPTEYKSKYEIYIAIMRITVDKVGVDYSEIGIEKSFTDDLGVD